ncbi:hypothetical protein [Bradyrhizobium murdochi]|uniref:hypothetical protein n=1 Tax=Bradyrhizobium murdochi TaxID=1038859 RepID=UPI000425566D|nr:hypothetical protein [Bradyrhizobium murdochi]
MKFHFHHHVRLEDALARMIVAHLADISDRLAALTRTVIKSERIIMVGIKELQDQANDTLASVQAETDVVHAVKKVVDDQNATINL